MTLLLTHTPPYLPSSLRLRIRLWQVLDTVRQLVSAPDSLRSRSLQREFTELITEENANISRICFAYAESVDDFNDLRQDALINIWRGMNTFRDESSIRTWIYRVTINSCLSTIRKQKRHRHESLSALYDLIDTDNDRREDIEMMHRLISALSREDRAIIMMWLDEMSYDDIAAAMGMNRNTIATRIRRIKEKIKTNYYMEEQI